MSHRLTRVARAINEKYTKKMNACWYNSYKRCAYCWPMAICMVTIFYGHWNVKLMQRFRSQIIEASSFPRDTFIIKFFQIILELKYIIDESLINRSSRYFILKKLNFRNLYKYLLCNKRFRMLFDILFYSYRKWNIRNTEIQKYVNVWNI